MFWINHIPYEEADDKLGKIYDRVSGPQHQIDNILKVHSLRPHTLTAHMTLYKNVLHHSENTLPKWYLEVLGVYVSYINKCDYCVSHHFEGLRKLWKDDGKANSFLKSLKTNSLENFFGSKWFKGIAYAHMLTLYPIKLTKHDIEHLKKVSFSDGEILEMNQVISYFNYANRTVLGLGVNTEGDVLGLSPNSVDSDHWGHQ